MKKNTKRKERLDIPFYELEIVKVQKIFQKNYLKNYI